MSEWADRERVLSPESSAEPGKWDTSRAEYLRGLMDAASDPEVQVIVAMFASQTGKTEALQNIVGFHVDQDPSPTLVVMPTLDLAESYSKDRLAPMLRDTPALEGKISDSRSRDSENTLLHKRFPGGHITMAGANSPASLASRPIRLLVCDEVDRYPPSAGTEGDPVSLARKRTTTFWNRKIVLTSSPSIKGLSRIEQAYLESDQRRLWVPCGHCGEWQTLQWKQVQWSPGRPEEAGYECAHCHVIWTDVERWAAVAKGEWRAGAPFNGIAGFHLSELYSSWVHLADTVRNFLEAKPHQERLKVWVNTALAETWEEDAEKLDENVLRDRVEDWGEKPPAEILIITAGVDVQDDRIEVEIVGWGLGEESWSLDHQVLYGDPSGPFLWNQLDDLLLTRIKTADGVDLPISVTAVDTGGHYTQAAYAFCKERWHRRVYAIKGMGGAGRRVWPKKASRNNKGGVNLFLIGVDAAKDVVISRLKKKQVGPAYCHFPIGREAEYFKQFTAEKVVTKYVRGFPVRVYKKDPSIRNEALDLRVYAYAAFLSLNVNWGRTQKWKQDERVRQKDLFKSERQLPPEYAPEAPGAPPVPASGTRQPPRGGRRVVRSSFVGR